MKKAQNNKMTNVAGSVLSSLVMDGYRKPNTAKPNNLQATFSLSTGLSRSQHVSMFNVKNRQMYSYGGYQGVFNETHMYQFS